MAEMDSDVMEAETTQTVGERLQAARLAAGLELSDIAGRTRVPLRHLEAIERGDYGALPATTYATGFASAYARALELDDVALIRDLREELQHIAEAPEYQPYEAADPARVPPGGLPGAGSPLALVVLALFGWWYSSRLASPSAARRSGGGPGTALPRRRIRRLAVLRRRAAGDPRHRAGPVDVLDAATQTGVAAQVYR